MLKVAEYPVRVVRGMRSPLVAGPAFEIWEIARNGSREYVTLQSGMGEECVLEAVSDEQMRAWRNKKLVAKPVYLVNG